MNLRHRKPPEYEYLGAIEGREGWCRIKRKDGAIGDVKLAWLKFADGQRPGATCTPGSFRKSFHVENANWWREV